MPFVNDRQRKKVMMGYKDKLLGNIARKQMELNQLQSMYDQQVETEKRKVLQSKSKGMEKTLYLTKFEFESSSQRTEQYLEWHRTFRREFTNVLKPYTEKIEISKPNHFDASGFFQMKDGKIYYFRIGDLRWDKDSMLIREAKDFKDYGGGSNNFIRLDDNFESNLKNYLGVK